MQSDQRKTVRKPLRYLAWLTTNGDDRRECVLSDVSETGARLEITDTKDIPDKFVLLLSANNSPKRFCRVVWREDSEIGVTFEGRQPIEKDDKKKKSAARPTDRKVSDADAAD